MPKFRQCSIISDNQAKNQCAEARSFFTFANNSRSKQNEKNPNTLL